MVQVPVAFDFFLVRGKGEVGSELPRAPSFLGAGPRVMSLRANSLQEIKGISICSLCVQTACKKSLVVRAIRSACKLLARNYWHFDLLALRANRVQEINGSSSNSLYVQQLAEMIGISICSLFVQTTCEKSLAARVIRSACKQLARNYWYFDLLALRANRVQDTYTRL